MELTLTRDADEFAARVGALLTARVDTNILASVLQGARQAVYGDERPLFAYGTEAGHVVCAALRTPPWGLLCGPLPHGAAEPLLERWLSHDPEPPWVSAVPDTARAVAEAWERLTGGRAELQLSEAMHVCEEVLDPPRPANGRLRVAGAEDRERLLAWTRAFLAEALPGQRGGDPAPALGLRLAAGRVFVWEDGDSVCTVTATTPIAGLARINNVYTPPEHRRRGYASSAVAAVTRRVLASEAPRCMLYTDLANPTSNKIYAEVGYRRISGWEEWRLLSPGAGREGAPPAG